MLPTAFQGMYVFTNPIQQTIGKLELTIQPPNNNRVPRLNPFQIRLFLALINRLKIPKRAKDAAKGVILTAANPAADTVPTNIASLPFASRDNIATGVESLSENNRSVVSRGGSKLLAMSESEFNRLLEESNQE